MRVRVGCGQLAPLLFRPRNQAVEKGDSFPHRELNVFFREWCRGMLHAQIPKVDQLIRSAILRGNHAQILQ